MKILKLSLVTVLSRAVFVCLTIIFLLFLGVVAVRFFSTSYQVSNLQVTNLTGRSVSIVFTTDRPADMCAIVLPEGRSVPLVSFHANCVKDDRRSGLESVTHHISFGELVPGTEYRVYLYAGYPSMRMRNQELMFASPAVSEEDNPNSLHTIYGKLVDKGGTLVGDALVLVVLEDRDRLSLPLSQYVTEGNWSVDIAEAVNSEGLPFVISDETVSHIQVIDFDEKTYDMEVKYGYDRPVGVLMLDTLITGARNTSDLLMSPVYAQLPTIDWDGIDLEPVNIAGIGSITLPGISGVDFDTGIGNLLGLVTVGEGLTLAPLPSIDLIDDGLPEMGILNNPDVLGSGNLTSALNLSTPLGQYSSSVLGTLGALSGNEDVLNDLMSGLQGLSSGDFSTFSTALSALSPTLVSDLEIMDVVSASTLEAISSDGVINIGQLLGTVDAINGYSGTIPTDEFTTIALGSLVSAVGEGNYENSTEALGVLFESALQKSGSSALTSFFTMLSQFSTGGNASKTNGFIQQLTGNNTAVDALGDATAGDFDLFSAIMAFASRSDSPFISTLLGLLGQGGMNSGSGLSGSASVAQVMGPACCCEGRTMTGDACGHCARVSMSYTAGVCSTGYAWLPMLLGGGGPGYSGSAGSIAGAGGSGMCTCNTSGVANAVITPQNLGVAIDLYKQYPNATDLSVAQVFTIINEARSTGRVERQQTLTGTYSSITPMAQCTPAYCAQAARNACSGLGGGICTGINGITADARWNAGPQNTRNVLRAFSHDVVFSAYAEEVTVPYGILEIPESGQYRVSYESVTFDVDVPNESGLMIMLYDDQNGNGVRDEEEGQIVHEVKVDVEKLGDLQRIYLNSGYNYVAFDVLPNGVETSQELAVLFASQGAQIKSISEFRSGRWNTFITEGGEGYSSPFVIEPYRGYIVNMLVPGTVDIVGSAETGNPFESTEAGWNLIGFNTDFGGSSVVDVANIASLAEPGEDVSIYYWDPKRNVFDGYIIRDGKTYGSSFFIMRGESYFVYDNGGR